jgi:hypothetical protein
MRKDLVSEMLDQSYEKFYFISLKVQIFIHVSRAFAELIMPSVCQTPNKKPEA